VSSQKQVRNKHEEKAMIINILSPWLRVTPTTKNRKIAERSRGCVSHQPQKTAKSLKEYRFCVRRCVPVVVCPTNHKKQPNR